MINRKNLFVSPLLTQTSLAYRNENYIAEKVFPVIQVKKDTGQIATYGADNLRIAKSYRAQGSRAAEVGQTITIGAHYELEEHCLEQLVTDEEVEQADSPISPKIDAVENITDRLLVEKEYALSTYLNSSSNLTKYTTLTGSTQWDKYSTSDPIGDIKTAKESVRTYAGKNANVLIIAKNAYDTLIDHPDIVDRIKYAKAATKEEVQATLARIFGLDNILVGNALYNNALEGASDSLTDVWSKFAVVAFIEQSPTLKSRSLGFTYQSKSPRYVDSYREEARKGDLFRVTDKYDQKAVDVTAAYLVLTCIA